MLVRIAALSVGLLVVNAVGAATPVAVTPGPEFAAARQPQVAVGPNGAVHIAFGLGNAIWYASSADGGRSFAPPVKVGERGALALGKRRGPRIAAVAGGVAVAAVCGERGGGKDGDLLVWRSGDGGRTWAGPVKVNRVPGSAREGLHELTASADGRLFGVWLDLRAGKSQVYGALSADGGATWGDDRLVYESPGGAVCPCCQPSACFDARGRLHVLWRNNLDDDRDMFLISSADGGRTWDAPRKLGAGTWHLRACPMDGGGLAADAGGTVHTIWRRQQAIYRSVDGGPETSLGPGEQGRAARGPDGVYLTWISQRPGTLYVLPPSVSTPRQIATRAADPAVAAAPDGRGPVVVVWEEPEAAGGPIRAQTIIP
ncbi:MAG TPA: sialidase family protein [Gemmataceae bacterium]|jgi:hypothetical protein